MIEFADLSAVDMLRAFRSRELSPVEVTEAVIQRIALWEPSLKALYAYDPDGARAAAKESEDGEWLVLRCVNVTDRPVDGRWSLPFEATEVRLARLDETPEGSLTPAGKVVPFAAGAGAVVTILVR